METPSPTKLAPQFIRGDYGHLNMHTINLKKYQAHGERVFAGRAKGQRVRDEERLSELIETGEPILVLIPENVFSVNSSFFLGMFTEAILKLGPEEFRNRFSFEGIDMREAVEAGILEVRFLKGDLF